MQLEQLWKLQQKLEDSTLRENKTISAAIIANIPSDLFVFIFSPYSFLLIKLI